MKTSGAKTAFSLFFVLVLSSCKHSAIDPLAHGWTKIEGEPATSALLLKQAEESHCVWEVGLEAHQLAISPVTRRIHQHLQEIRLQIPSGTLIGLDRGEWG